MTVKKDRIEAIIQKEVSSIIQMELKDPKLGFITITDVTVTNDLSIAKIYVTFLGKQERIDAGMKTLGKKQRIHSFASFQADDDPQGSSADFPL